MSLLVVKRSKRLCIMDGDSVVYAPPDFLRNRCNRDLLNRLAWAIEHSGVSRIEAVTRFETLQHSGRLEGDSVKHFGL